MHVVFVHGWSVTHTDTYGELPRWLSKQPRGYKIQNVYLGKYISFFDSLAPCFRACSRSVSQSSGTGSFSDSPASMNCPPMV